MPRMQNSTGSGGVAASPRRDDRSGLLDIRALSSVIDTQRRAQPTASASSLALPRFTTPWTAPSLRPLQPVAPQAAPPVIAAPEDNRPLYAMIGVLSLVVASLGAYVLLRPPPTPEASGAIAVAPVVVPAEEDSDSDEEAEPEAEPVLVAAAPTEKEAEPEAEPEPEPKAERSRNRNRNRNRNRDRTKPPRSQPQPKVQPKASDNLSVDCIIDPKKCTKSGRPRPEPTTSTKGLPATPSSTQIRTAMAEVKPQAKACGPRHGGSSGTKVRIKLSVKGATGKISSAKALDDHAGTALGRCVAGALSKAKMPRFSKPQAGIVYAVRM